MESISGPSLNRNASAVEIFSESIKIVRSVTIIFTVDTNVTLTIRHVVDYGASLALVCKRWRIRRGRRNKSPYWGRRASWREGKRSSWGMLRLLIDSSSDAFWPPFRWESKHVLERYYFCSACTVTLTWESTDHHSGKHWSRPVYSIIIINTSWILVWWNVSLVAQPNSVFLYVKSNNR